jgi:ABC-type nitrate/sulfonate/bicarbonate transport system permease component
MTSIASLRRPALSRFFTGWRKGAANQLPTIISLAVLIAIWESVVRLLNINELLLPAPSVIGLELIEVSNRGLLWRPLANTLLALAVGLLASLLIGIPVGILIGASRVMDLLSTPYMWALRATPRIAIAPLIAIWVGFGFGAKFWMVFLSAAITVMLITQEGVKTVDQGLVHVARSFGASRRDIYLQIVLPYILPFVANAVRNGIGIGIVAVLVVEMFSATGGLGSQVMRASLSYDGPRMYAYILVLMAVSLALIALSRRLENYVSQWREEAYV